MRFPFYRLFYFVSPTLLQSSYKQEVTYVSDPVKVSATFLEMKEVKNVLRILLNFTSNISDKDSPGDIFALYTMHM